MRMPKVRLYLTNEQVRAIRDRAQLDGVSPSVVVRAAVDKYLELEPTRKPAR